MFLRVCSCYLTYGQLATPTVLLTLLDTKLVRPPATQSAGARSYTSDDFKASGAFSRSDFQCASHNLGPQDASAPHSAPHAAAELLARQDNAYRRGFGAKVALPAKDVLQESLVDQPATLKLRAYHIGKCIHIGQVAKRAKALGCRTNSGKDYCMIWLDRVPDSINSNTTSKSHRSNQQQQGKGQLSEQTARIVRMKAWAQNALWARLRLGEELDLHLPAVLQKEDSKRSKVWRKPFPGSVMDVPYRPREASKSDGVPCMMVVYRYGSVVFAGTQMWWEPWLVEEYVPQRVRYIAGGHGNTWTTRDPMSMPLFPQEEQTVVVKPDASEPAVKGVDTVELRVLDVGSVRVLTSVLGQSVALKFYETSVGDALDKLSQWRARTRRAARFQQTGGIGFFSGSQEQTTLFKVIAASALIINEARELLEMAEPAWQYSTYHSIWSLAADDFELEKRFRALEIKLHQVEKEAKHDVKQREGRKYHKLEQSVVLLLMVSCILAVLHLSKKLLNKSSSSSSDLTGLDAAVAGLSVQEGSMTEAESEAVQQLQLRHEQTAAAAAEYGDAASAAAADSDGDSSQNWSENGRSDGSVHTDDNNEAVQTDGTVSHVSTQTDSGTTSTSSRATASSSSGRGHWWPWARKGA